MTVQDVLNDVPVAGVPKVSRHDELPLKTFAKDELSLMPFTGYKTKGNWYYKIKAGQNPVNVSANKLNELFATLLRGYQYKPALRSHIATTLKVKLKERLLELGKDATQAKKKIAEKKSLLEKVEQKFINDQISEEIYIKHAGQIKEEIVELSKESDTSAFNSSNFDNAVEKCLTIAENISQSWVTAKYEGKQQLQKLIFPEGILYNKQNGVVRTSRVNSLFAAIPLLAGDSSENKKADSLKNRLKSNDVPRTGFEPAHPCERCDLNTVRLPISPPGQWRTNIQQKGK